MQCSTRQHGTKFNACSNYIMQEDNRRKLREINEELNCVDASGNRLQGIERDLRKAEKELDTLQGQTDVNLLNKDVKKLLADKKDLEDKLTKLRDEQTRIHIQSTIQTKIDMKVKEKQGKEDSIQTMYV